MYYENKNPETVRVVRMFGSITREGYYVYPTDNGEYSHSPPKTLTPKTVGVDRLGHMWLAVTGEQFGRVMCRVRDPLSTRRGVLNGSQVASGHVLITVYRRRCNGRAVGRWTGSAGRSDVVIGLLVDVDVEGENCRRHPSSVVVVTAR